MRKLGWVLVMALAGGAALSVSAGSHEDGEGGHHGKFMRKMLDRMDADGDGLVSEAEFVGAHRERFAKMDADGDGQLSHEEMAAHHSAKREQRREKREMRREHQREE